jgi:hypothetical protein
VYPLEHAPQWGPERRLVWDERQRYTAGYMRSRVTTQFIAARTSRTRAALSVTWPEGRQSPPQIENRLGTRILQLVVRDEAGRDYWAEGVDKGAAVRPQPADPSAASERLRQELANNRPADPPQFDPSDYQRSFGMGLGLRHSYSYWEYGDQWLSEPSTEDGILETSLRGVGAMGIQSLPRGGYVAIVESCDEVPLGIERAREEASLHVIQGRW